MTRHRKHRPEDILNQIDLRLDGLLGQLGAQLEEAFRSLEGLESGEIQHERDIRTGTGPIKARAGIRVRVGGVDVPGDGAAARRETPRAKPASPAAAEPPAPMAPSPTEREIDATILEDASGWTLVAELPGVTRDGLHIEPCEGGVAIRAEGRGRRYSGRFTLPDGIAIDDLRVHLLNGILELSAAGEAIR